jgi:hypothetical protein
MSICPSVNYILFPRQDAVTKVACILKRGVQSREELLSRSQLAVRKNDLNLALLCLHYVNVRKVAGVSEVHTVSVFRVKVYRVGVCVYIGLRFGKKRLEGGQRRMVPLMGRYG